MKNILFFLFLVIIFLFSFLKIIEGKSPEFYGFVIGGIVTIALFWFVLRPIMALLKDPQKMKFYWTWNKSLSSDNSQDIKTCLE